MVRLTNREINALTNGTMTLNGTPVRVVFQVPKDKYETWCRCGGAGETRTGGNGETRYYIG